MYKSLAWMLLLAASAAAAEPVDAFKPMAFLAGHCWKGQFADGKQSEAEEHRLARGR